MNQKESFTLEAIASINGYKIYSHEAFTYFLIEEDEKLLADKFDKFRKIRNGIVYYRKNISVEEVKEIIVDIFELIEKLRYLKELK